MPCAKWARISAVAGATRRRSIRCATAMCSMALSTLAASAPLAPNISVITFFPVSAAKVSGVMNSCAERVITTCTSSFSCCRRRTSSAALYAATPPVTPRAIFMVVSRGGAVRRGGRPYGTYDFKRAQQATPLLAAFAVLVQRALGHLGQGIFEESEQQLFFGDAR